MTLLANSSIAYFYLNTVFCEDVRMLICKGWKGAGLYPEGLYPEHFFVRRKIPGRPITGNGGRGFISGGGET